VGEYVLKPYLKYYGISHIDGIIVSHEDADHCNGIVELLEHRGEWGIEIENILLPYVEGEEFEDILSVCAQEKAGTPAIIYINTGACWQDGTVKFTCMHPPEAWSCENINAASACFLVESGDYSLLLTGDVEAEGEELLLEELKNADISEITMLKVAHHGSRNSTSAELLNTVKPLISVISCGKSNTYGHPHDELIDRLEKSLTKIYSTMESGAVTVRCSKDNIMIEEWCGSRSCIQN
ncbi:MAG: MBL fold metallo-hydrolase, partial [Lachnospiraceae bacterium]|nr:MBL fold metallo-hydrolase [Lachnospiraceae bacterium]